MKTPAACQPRSPATYVATLATLDVEHAESYRAGRLIPGTTWCNLYLSDGCAALGVGMPFVLANDQCDWLHSPMAAQRGWVALVDSSSAKAAAELGQPTVAVWKNPGSHGHVAFVIPSGRPGIHISQAGRVNYASAPLSWGFGEHTPAFFTHP